MDNSNTPNKRMTWFGNIGLWATILLMVLFAILSSEFSAKKFNTTNKGMTLKRRFGHIGIWATVFLVVFLIGSYTSLSDEESKELLTALAQATANIGDGDPIFIAKHNISVSIFQFIPGFGFVLGAMSALMTGTVISAISMEINIIQPWMGILLFLTPVGILELSAYALAMSRSWLWTVMLIKHRTKANIKSMIKPTIIEICILLTLLVIGGYVESWMIAEYGSVSLDLLDKYR